MTKHEKQARIELRVKEKDKERIRRLAKQCGLPISEYMVKRALGYAPRAALPDAFYDFYGKLCELCNADGVFYEDAEKKLLAIIDEIHKTLLLPRKSPAKEIRSEVEAMKWQPPDSGH